MDRTLKPRTGLAWLGVLLPLAGCAALATPPDVPTELTGFRVEGAGADAGGSFCADFRLTEAQVQRFFERAVPMTAAEVHDALSTLPCWVRGSAVSHAMPVQWEVRAGGTAEVRAGDRATQLFGCTTCDDLLGGTPQH